MDSVLVSSPVVGSPSSLDNGAVSLAARIAHARERAESFTSRHGQQSRESRKDLPLPVDKERLRWTQLYHEKSVAIEQLERELGITVDALHRSQRSQIDSDGVASKEPESKPTHLDLLNLTDALRKENSSIKSNLESFQERNACLEEDLAMLKRENLNLKREVDILQRQLTSSSDRWLKQEAEYNASISSLESEVINLRAESILHKDADKSAEKRRADVSPVKFQNERATAADHELHTTRLLLSTAREEVSWLRDILEYEVPYILFNTHVESRTKLDMVVPPFKAGMPLPSILPLLSQHVSKDTENTTSKSVQTEADEPELFEASAPSVAPVKNVSQDPNMVDADALSSIADVNSFDDMERTIARAQQTKVSCLRHFHRIYSMSSRGSSRS